MYRLRRLRALLRTLLVTPPSRFQVIRGWLLVILGYAAFALFALSLVVHSSRDWPVTWHDVVTFDLVARTYLLGAFAAFVSGCSFLFWIASVGSGSSARMLPQRDFGPALRRAIRIREPHVAPADPATPSAQQGDTPAATRLTVATSHLLIRSLWLAIVTLAGGALALLPVFFFTSWAFWVAGPPPDPDYAMPDAIAGSYRMLGYAGIFASLAVIAAIFAWRHWIGWRAGIRGAEVEISPEGLAICDHTTLWRRRFIRWSEIVSLARFTYNDDYVRPHTVYLLDAGNQALLWESPPDMRYEAPARRARIAERQASAAQLLMQVRNATGLPLLNITSIISKVAKIEPDPNNIEDEPDPKDIELLGYVESTLSEQDLITLTPPLSSAEKWRRLLMSGLVLVALWASAFLLR